MTRRFWKYLLRPVHIVLVLGVMASVQLLERWGWLDGPSAALLDSFHILAQTDAPSHVVIVDITEDDYRQVFKETSPLDPQTIAEIVRTIAVFRPLVIGVDVDTSAAVFSRLEPPTGPPPVVWAVAARQQGETEGSQGAEPTLAVDPVLGRPSPDHVRTGLSLFVLDPDNTVRRYSRAYEVVAADGQPRRIDSFPTAVSRAAGNPGANGRSDSDRPVLIRFARFKLVSARLSASFVLHAATEHARAPGQPWPRLLDLLRDKVVLVGGTYGAARDSFHTPYGRTSGVDLVAAAVETEFAGGGMKDVHRLAMLALDIGLAVLLIYFGYALRVRLMLACDVAVILVVTLLSFAAFSSGLVWLDTVPLLVAVVLHQWGHRVSEERRGRPGRRAITS